MSVEHPTYWLVYVPASTEISATEVAAIAPEQLSPEQFCRDTQWLLAATFGYRVHHTDRQVVFAGEVTRWLHVQGVSWADVDVDLGRALRGLARHAAVRRIESSDVEMAVVAASVQVTVFQPDGSLEDSGKQVERVRCGLLRVLDHDWDSSATT